MITLKSNEGFTIVEIVVGIVILGLVVMSFGSLFQAINESYRLTRSFNDLYTVASNIPELDRGIKYDALSETGTTPQIVPVDIDNENGGIITYSPSILVQPSTSVTETSAIPNSKVVDVSIDFQKNSSTTVPIKLRLLITRNGIAQR